MMQRVLIGAVLVIAALSVAEVASATEFCLGLSNFDNVFRFEAANLGADIFSIVGHDRIHEERATSGTVYLGDTFAELGFSDFASSFTAHFQALLSLASGSGPYSLTFNGTPAVTTGTMFVISCAAVPARAEGVESGAAGLPDLATVARQP